MRYNAIDAQFAQPSTTLRPAYGVYDAASSLLVSLSLKISLPRIRSLVQRPPASFDVSRGNAAAKDRGARKTRCKSVGWLGAVYSLKPKATNSLPAAQLSEVHGYLLRRAPDCSRLQVATIPGGLTLKLIKISGCCLEELSTGGRHGRQQQ